MRRFKLIQHQCEKAGTFEPHLAGMGEDGRAIAFDMLVEPDAGASLGHYRCERGLADLKWIAPQVAMQRSTMRDSPLFGGMLRADVASSWAFGFCRL
jgi:hypothetical protein